MPTADDGARPTLMVPDGSVERLIARVRALVTESSTPLTWDADHANIISDFSRPVMLEAIKRLIVSDMDLQRGAATDERALLAESTRANERSGVADDDELLDGLANLTREASRALTAGRHPSTLDLVSMHRVCSEAYQRLRAQSSTDYPATDGQRPDGWQSQDASSAVSPVDASRLAAEILRPAHKRVSAGTSHSVGELVTAYVMLTGRA